MPRSFGLGFGCSYTKCCHIGNRRVEKETMGQVDEWGQMDRDAQAAAHTRD